MKFKIKNSFEDESGEYWYEADGCGYRSHCKQLAWEDQNCEFVSGSYVRSMIFSTEKEAREWLENQWKDNNGIKEIIDDFCTKLASEQKDIPPEFEKTFRKHYSKLLARF